MNTYIGDLLFTVSKQLKTLTERELKEFDIGIGQLQILLIFYSDLNKFYTQSEIVNLVEVDKGNISRSIKKLMDKNYIEVDSVNTNCLKLTNQGLELNSIIKKKFMDINQNMLKNLNQEDIQTTQETLMKISHNFKEIL